MTRQLPRSGLIRLNIIISTALSVLLALFLLALNKDVADIVFRFFQTLICASLGRLIIGLRYRALVWQKMAQLLKEYSRKLKSAALLESFLQKDCIFIP